MEGIILFFSASNVRELQKSNCFFPHVSSEISAAAFLCIHIVIAQCLNACQSH